MKKLALAAAITAVAATASFAGGMEEPMMEMAPVVVEEGSSASSAGNMVVPLILLALVALAVANN